MGVSRKIIALSESINSNQRISQNFLLIWLDGNIDKSTVDYQDTFSQLQSVVNIVNVFTEQNEAIDFLTELDELKVFLLIGGNESQHILPLIHDIPQLDVIYILTSNISQHEQLVEKWIKIKGVHTDTQPLCEALKLEVKQCNQDLADISFVTPGEECLKLNLNQLEPTFMYTQIFKETILEMEYNDQSVKNLANYCRKFYENNTRELNIIHDFEHNYRSKSPIWWYTRQCFTYQMLNQALRTLEGGTIINMGFFIRDLHKQIQELYREQIATHRDQYFTVYRGQGLSITDFEKLQRTIGGLMSFNNFLSTSTKPDVSLRFTRTALRKTNMVGVLFQMVIDPSISSAPFASIQEVSYYRREEEILFSMHTIFRIGAIKKIDQSKPLYQVDLQLTADDDQELRTLTAVIRKEVADETGWRRLGLLLLKIGQLEKAEELYNLLFDQTSDQCEQAFYHNQLGYIKDHQGEYEKAIEYNKKALEIRQKCLPPNHPSLATSYNNISSVYSNMGEYSKALSFYEKALEIFKKSLPSNHPSLATSYNNIGTMYSNMGEYSKALSYYEKDLEICQKILPPNHPSLASVHNNIGSAYDNMGEYSKALSFFQQSLKIRHKILPSDHPDLATSYNNVGSEYDNMGDYTKALSFYEKALEICQKVLAPNHHSLSTSYNNIGMTYLNMGQYSKALSFYEKDLEIGQKTLSSNHPDIATSYNNMGSVYKGMGEYSKALSFYEKAFEIFEKTLPPNHHHLATSYNNIGLVYFHMKEYSKALSFYEKGHEIFQKSLPPNHHHLASSYNNIGMAYLSMKEYSKALAHFEHSEKIFRNTLPVNHLHIKSVRNAIDYIKKILLANV